mgnify:CR=1 FL=1
MKSRDTPFGVYFTERYQLYLNHESEENFFDSIEKMLISVDKKFSNEVCKHWGIIDAGTVLLIRQSYEENKICNAERHRKTLMK